MSCKRNSSGKMVVTKKNKSTVFCSTPEQQQESPSKDSDSLSDAGSPVPFLCTQDGADGETDVVWNYYTPKAEHTACSRVKNKTPLSRKVKKTIKQKLIEKPLIKRKPDKVIDKKNELFQELFELNQNLHELIDKKKAQKCTEKQVTSKDDIILSSIEFSPKSGLKTNKKCLRKNLLNSKFSKPDPETALESDDSMNECLLKASQIVEENVFQCLPPSSKRTKFNYKNPVSITNPNFNLDQDSMDAILNSIKLDSPTISKRKTHESPKLNNDSFDSIVGNLNDSALERLTQVPLKKNYSDKILIKDSTDWLVKDIVVHDGSPSNKTIFTRHSSMPESPSVTCDNKPSTSGMAFGRYNSMPIDKSTDNLPGLGDSPITCTPEEIKRKHQQAREKLQAKRQLPFTNSQLSQTQVSTLVSSVMPPKNNFQPKVPSTAHNKIVTNNISQTIHQKESENRNNIKAEDLKLIIEKKRQEALQKLRRKQIPNKMP